MACRCAVDEHPAAVLLAGRRLGQAGRDHDELRGRRGVEQRPGRGGSPDGLSSATRATSGSAVTWSVAVVTAARSSIAWSWAASRSSTRDPTRSVVATTDRTTAAATAPTQPSTDRRRSRAAARSVGCGSVASADGTRRRRCDAAAAAARGRRRPARDAVLRGRRPASGRAARAPASSPTTSRPRRRWTRRQPLELERARRRSRRGAPPRPSPSGCRRPSADRDRPARPRRSRAPRAPFRDPSSPYPSSPIPDRLRGRPPRGPRAGAAGPDGSASSPCRAASRAARRSPLWVSSSR